MCGLIFLFSLAFNINTSNSFNASVKAPFKVISRPFITLFAAFFSFVGSTNTNDLGYSTSASSSVPSSSATGLSSSAPTATLSPINDASASANTATAPATTTADRTIKVGIFNSMNPGDDLVHWDEASMLRDPIGANNKWSFLFQPRNMPNPLRVPFSLEFGFAEAELNQATMFVLPSQLWYPNEPIPVDVRVGLFSEPVTDSGHLPELHNFRPARRGVESALRNNLQRLKEELNRQLRNIDANDTLSEEDKRAQKLRCSLDFQHIGIEGLYGLALGAVNDQNAQVIDAINRNSDRRRRFSPFKALFRSKGVSVFTDHSSTVPERTSESYCCKRRKLSQPQEKSKHWVKICFNLEGLTTLPKVRAVMQYFGYTHVPYGDLKIWDVYTKTYRYCWPDRKVYLYFTASSDDIITPAKAAIRQFLEFLRIDETQELRSALDVFEYRPEDGMERQKAKIQQMQDIVCRAVKASDFYNFYHPDSSRYNSTAFLGGHLITAREDQEIPFSSTEEMINLINARLRAYNDVLTRRTGVNRPNPYSTIISLSYLNSVCGRYLAHPGHLGGEVRSLASVDPNARPPFPHNPATTDYVNDAGVEAIASWLNEKLNIAIQDSIVDLANPEAIPTIQRLKYPLGNQPAATLKFLNALRSNSEDEEQVTRAFKEMIAVRLIDRPDVIAKLNLHPGANYSDSVLIQLIADKMKLYDLARAQYIE